MADPEIDAHVEGIRKGVEGLAHAEPFMVVLDGMQALGKHALELKDAGMKKAGELKDRFLGGSAEPDADDAALPVKPIAIKSIAAKPVAKPVPFVGPVETKPLTRERGLQRMRAGASRSLSKR